MKYKYPALFEEWPDGFTASWDYLGYFSTYGTTKQEARKAAAECLSLYCKGAEADGKKLPRPRKPRYQYDEEIGHLRRYWVEDVVVYL